jgi:hypothetical protein
MNKSIFVIALVFLAFGIAITSANAQGPRPGNSRVPSAAVGTGFTYQGQLKNNGALVNGTCDLTFRLFDDINAGNQIGNPITQTLAITNGLFTTQLNAGNEFGANAFSGDARWLAIRVSTTCPSTGSFVPLTPREPITPAPYALTAMKTAYKNILVVAKSGGHYNTITDALNSISDNSASSRYLIYVAPGLYAETVTMKPFVDIEGAGEIPTKITQTGSSSSLTGTVIGADNAELRFLTVENTGGNTYATAIYNSSASPRLTHITATSSGGTTGNIGVSNIIASPRMTNVTAFASGGTNNYGIYNSLSSPTMTDDSATASGGTNSYGVYNTASASPTMMNVTATASGGTNNFGVYNSSSSPAMTNVIATASGGTQNYGVVNDSSSPTMINVTATASGGTYNTGVVNSNSSSPAMINVTASASGGTENNDGVHNDSSSPTMINVTATGTGSGGKYAAGVSNNASSVTINGSRIRGSGGSITSSGITNGAPSGSYTLSINNSQIIGDTGVTGDSHVTIRIGASKLEGSWVTTSGTPICVYVYDGNYAALNSTCQ